MNARPRAQAPVARPAIVAPVADPWRPRQEPGAVALRVVVVGGGIAGQCAALRLAARGATVELIEASHTLGGACRAAEVALPDGDPLSLDLGVSDFNRATFTQLSALLGDLGQPLTPVCQEASFRAPDGRWLWSSGPCGVQLAPGTPRGFVEEITRFQAEAPEAVDPRQTAGDWLRERGHSDDFRRFFFVPRALGCFPSPGGDVTRMPMRSLARFWGMHGVVGPGPADRVCVRGDRYLPALRTRLESLGVRIRLNEPVRQIVRDPLLVLTNRSLIAADALVLALDPGAALQLLQRPTAAEQDALAAVRTQPGRMVLHRDEALMPADAGRWAAYNYFVPDDLATAPERPTITFFPERLARLERADRPLPPLFATLNPPREPRDIVAEHLHLHPVFGRSDAEAAALRRLQGVAGTWYCGAWTEEPFLHEQGVASGFAAADAVVDGWLHEEAVRAQRVVRSTAPVRWSACSHLG